MKKLFTLILLSVFLFNLAAIPVWFHITQFMIREDMDQKVRENPDESELTILTVSEQEFSRLLWTRAQKELKYKGEMYDVVKITSSGHQKLIYCLTDSKEKQLLALYRSHQRSRQKTKHNKTEFSKFFPAKQDHLLQSRANDIHYSEPGDQLILNQLSPPSPPPKPIISC